MGKLDDRVALITAVGPNNGGTIAAKMAEEGAKIVCNDIIPMRTEETVAHLRSKGWEAIGLTGDAADESHVKAMVKAGVDAYGHIDTLVNLAGRQHPGGVLDFNLDNWNREMATFLTGAAMCMKEVANLMVSQGRRGAIINIVSIDAYEGHATRLGYSTVKAGLLNMTRAAAADLAHLGIRVNSISPGWMEHNLWRRRPPQEPPPRDRFNVTSQDGLDSIPMGRFIRSSDLAPVAVFLASDDASIMTGVDIPVDGGATSSFHQWVPGRYTQVSVDEYIKTKALYQRYGETVEGPGVNTSRITWNDENI